MSIRRHTAYNIAGALVPLGVTILVTPRYLQEIGEARYGVLAILWVLLGYFGLFDLGIGRAVANKIAAMRTAPAGEREDFFWTALGINIVLGSVGAFAFWGVGHLILSSFVEVPSGLVGEVQRALPWMVLAFPLLLTAGVFSGALQGREEFLVQNVVQVSGSVLTQITPLAVAIWHGPELPYLVGAVLVIRVLTGGALLIACRIYLPTGSRPTFVRAHVRPLLSYGGWISVTSIVAPLLTTLDRVLIGAVVGAQAVTYYVVPMNLATRVTILPGALSRALFPRFSGQNDAEAEQLLYRSTRLLVVVTLPAIIAGLWLMEPFLTLWMGSEFASRAAPVGQWVVIGLWMNVFAYPAASSLPARGRPDVPAKLYLVEAVAYVPALWIALTYHGIAGAAAVWALRNTGDAIALLVIARVDLRIWSLIMQSFGFVCVGTAIVVGLSPLSGGAWAAIAGLLGLVVLWAWRTDPGLFNSLHRGLRTRHSAP